MAESNAESVKTRYYYGTRAELTAGDLIEPGPHPAVGESGEASSYAHFTPDLDAAIWAAELAAGDCPGRVYEVEPTGQIETSSDRSILAAPPHPTMSLRSRDPLRVTGEVREWTLYHGTRADLKPGDLIKPGHAANFGSVTRTANYVYLARTLDAATWGAELATGEGSGRIYIVEPTGRIEDDPNVTDKKFRGNPTKSFRSLAPLRVLDEMIEWQGHSPGAIQAMKDGLERLNQIGIEPIDE